MQNLFPNPDPDAVEARSAAQRIAFGPMLFQAVRVARDRGLLTALEQAGETGQDLGQAVSTTGLSRYAVGVLLEAALALGVVRLRDDRWSLTKTGRFLLHDPMTRVNLDFVHAVCWAGLAHLEAAISEARPAGLTELGPWPTIYEGLSQLPAQAQRAWFAFDHYYSDHAFPAVLPRLRELAPVRVLDVGGNTGRFACFLARSLPSVQITICDLPGQWAMAQAQAAQAGLAGRIAGQAVDLLDPQAALPTGADLIWMSQFLCCFSEEQVISILRRAATAMGPATRLLILDTCPDRQRHPAAALSLIATSLYFTCMANGNSRMYNGTDFLRLIAAAGLQVDRQTDHLGLGHTLFECIKMTSPAA